MNTKDKRIPTGSSAKFRAFIPLVPRDGVIGGYERRRGTLAVPDVLGGVTEVEAFYALPNGRLSANEFVLDMSKVAFVKPYGVMALLTDHGPTPLYAVRRTGKVG